MFAPAARSPAAGCWRGAVLACWGQLLAPDPVPARGQQLFSTGHLKTSGLAELGDGDVAVPRAWDEAAPRWGDPRVENGQSPSCSSPRASARPTRRRCSHLEEKWGRSGVEPQTPVWGCFNPSAALGAEQKNGEESYFYGKSLLGAWSFDCLPSVVVSGGGGWEASSSGKGSGLCVGGGHGLFPPRCVGVLGTASGNSFLLAVSSVCNFFQQPNIKAAFVMVESHM